MRLIERLAALQALDSSLDEHRRRYNELQAELQPPHSLQALISQHNELKAALEHWQKEQNQRETAVADQTAKIQAQEKLLYGGKVKDPREQVNLQQNVEALKRHRQTLEEEALEAIMAVEQKSSELDEVDARLKAEAEQWKQRQSELQAEMQTVIGEARKLKVQRDTAALAVQPPMLKRYENLRQKKNGVAVVKIRGLNCGGCGSTLPTARKQRVFGDGLVTCPICGRLLTV